MTEPRPGYDEAMREIGRRAAENGLKLTHIDGNNIFGGRSRDLWREGWRQQKRAAIGLSSVKRD